MVHPFDDPFIIAGQGTVGLELLEVFPQIDTVLVPLSGGGLIAGIALALKSASPDIRTVGVTMERGPAMHDSLRAGKVVDIVEEPTLADDVDAEQVASLTPGFTGADLANLVNEAALVATRRGAEARQGVRDAMD